MTTPQDNRFARRLNLIRYAFGFRDHEHFTAKKRRAEIDLSRGKFAELLWDYMERHWADLEIPEGWPAEDVSKVLPRHETATRWFRDETQPSSKQLPGIVAALNKMLIDARNGEAFLTAKGATGRFQIDERFNFDVLNVDPKRKPGHQLAKEMGFRVEEFDEWWAEASNGANGSLLATEQLKFVGAYLIFRLHAEQDAVLQRDLVFIYENEERNGLRGVLIGSTEPPWRGDFELGRSTLSATMKRTSDFHGTQINTISLAHRGGANILHGFRTRIVEGIDSNIACYRVLMLKAEEERYASYLTEDLDDDIVLRGLHSAVQMKEGEEQGDEKLQLIREVSADGAADRRGDDL